jgi:copper chaperone
MAEELRYSVPGMHCAHCERALTEELTAVGGVAHVDVNLAAKVVVVRGEALDDGVLRRAIDEAGYEAA